MAKEPSTRDALFVELNVAVGHGALYNAELSV